MIENSLLKSIIIKTNTISPVKTTTYNIEGITYQKTSETTVKVIKKSEDNYYGSITIPSSINHDKINYHVTEICELAFKGNENITAISIGHNITTIKAYTFSNCSNLTSITLPNSVSSIGKSAFSYSGLTNFTFPNSVTTIETYLFISCEKLTTVTIPNTITTIKEYAFGWCPKLSSLVCATESPIRIPSNVFFGTDTDSCILQAPFSSIELYKTTNVWKKFSSIIPSTTLSTSNIETKNNMSIYPNLVQNNLFIEFDDSKEVTIEIFTQNGQVLIQKTITSSQNNINTSSLQTGMHWVKLTSDKGIITKKFMKY